MGRALAGIVLVGALACALPAAATAQPGPGPAGGFYTFTSGSDLEGTQPVADLGSGFDVWVDPAAGHVTRIAEAISFAVGQLNRYGIAVRYRGVAHSGHLPSGRGVITVTESTSTTKGACAPRARAEGGTITEAITFPTFQDVGVATRIDAADVTFCPPTWSHDQGYLAAIALHEMGHAVGLGHFPGEYDGRTQIMNPIVPDLSAYQAGDVNGLRYIAAQTAALQSQSVIKGSVESWAATPRGLTVTGWAVVGHTSEFADIAVTRDGTTVYSITTNTPRPDITQRYDARWPNPGFSGSQVPMADGTHRYCVIASAASSAAVTLGCKALAYPPATTVPPTPELPALGKAPIEVWWSSTAAKLGLGAAAVVLLLVVTLLWRRARSGSRER